MLTFKRRGKRGYDAPVNAVAASLATALAGANNDLTFTAKTKGVSGNSITISYVDPGEETLLETVTVTGTAIVVTLRNRSSTLSTAAQVKTAIEANAEAAALITVANKGADTGAGNVIALTATALAGGVDGTPGKPWDTMYNGGYLYFCASDAGNLISTGNWYKVQLTVVS
jgi:hypothetical protein